MSETESKILYLLNDGSPLTETITRILQAIGINVQLIEITLNDKSYNNITLFCNNYSDHIIYSFVKKRIRLLKFLPDKLSLQNIIIHRQNLSALCEDITQQWYSALKHDMAYWLNKEEFRIDNNWQKNALSALDPHSLHSWTDIAGDYYYCLIEDKTTHEIHFRKTLECSSYEIKLILADDQVCDKNGRVAQILPNIIRESNLIKNSVMERTQEICLITCSDGEKLINLLDDRNLIKFEDKVVIFLDLNFENEENGLDILTLLRKKSKNLPVIIFTATEDQNQIAEIFRRGAIGYFPKSSDDWNMLNSFLRIAFSQFEKTSVSYEKVVEIHWGTTHKNDLSVIHIDTPSGDDSCFLTHKEITVLTSLFDIRSKIDRLLVRQLLEGEMKKKYVSLLGADNYTTLNNLLETNYRNNSLITIGETFIPFNLWIMNDNKEKVTLGQMIPISHEFSRHPKREELASMRWGRRIFILDSCLGIEDVALKETFNKQKKIFKELRDKFRPFLEIKIFSEECQVYNLDLLEKILEHYQPNIIHVVGHFDNDTMSFKMDDDNMLPISDMGKVLPAQRPQLMVLFGCKTAFPERTRDSWPKTLLSLGVCTVIGSLWDISTSKSQTDFLGHFYNNLFSESSENLGKAFLSAIQETKSGVKDLEEIFWLNNFVMFGDKKLILA